MAGNSTVAGVAVASGPPKALVRPVLSANETMEYRRLCAKVGVGVPEAELHSAEVECLLERLGIPVYDLQKVHQHMTRTAGELGKEWVWRPLRAQDKSAACRVRYPLEGWFENRLWMGAVRREETYAQLVPFSVLATVEKILDAAPPGLEPCFLVSDYEVARPDPFLALAMRGRGFWVIDFWNEPGFRP